MIYNFKHDYDSFDHNKPDLPKAKVISQFYCKDEQQIDYQQL